MEVKHRPLLLRVDDAAQLLGISRAKAYQLVSSGRLPSVKIDRTRRVPLAALERWIENQIAEPESSSP